MRKIIERFPRLILPNQQVIIPDVTFLEEVFAYICMRNVSHMFQHVSHAL